MMKGSFRLLAVVMVVLATLSLGSCDWLMSLLGEDTDVGPIDWDTTAGDWSANTNAKYEVTLPAGGSEYPIWGTDVYTADSSIGTAAVHAGLITFAAGGTVTIQILPGESSYDASSRNGVDSQSYGAWDSSFKFVDADD